MGGGHTGGEVEGHDWEHILQTLGLLHRDHQIANAMQFAGAVLKLIGIGWGLVVALRPTAGEPSPDSPAH